MWKDRCAEFKQRLLQTLVAIDEKGSNVCIQSKINWHNV